MSIVRQKFIINKPADGVLTYPIGGFGISVFSVHCARRKLLYMGQMQGAAHICSMGGRKNICLRGAHKPIPQPSRKTVAFARKRRDKRKKKDGNFVAFFKTALCRAAGLPARILPHHLVRQGIACRRMRERAPRIFFGLLTCCVGGAVQFK